VLELCIEVMVMMDDGWIDEWMDRKMPIARNVGDGYD